MSELPWFTNEDRPPLPAEDPEVEAWARALCKAWGDKPDQLIGEYPEPRWRSFCHAARMAIAARKIVDATS